jgi:pimeloyl-ACP methyl ester carboxylesterase
MIPTLGQAGAMNSLAYQGDGEVGDESGWVRQKNLSCEHSGCTLVHWQHPDQTIYLSIRGTHGRRDAMDDLRIFFGHPPKSRIAFLERYIQEHCQQALDEDRLFVGGHSMGGMIAMAAAARWRLPGLVQNAPGWLANPPAPDTLSRMLEIRTGRDVVGSWGHCVPNTIVLHDPNAAKWDLRALHNRHRQMDLIERYGLTQMKLDDPRFYEQTTTISQHAHSPNTLGWIRATWLRVNEEHAIVSAMTRKPGKR